MVKPASSRGSGFGGLGFERGASLERRVRSELHRPGEARDQRRMVGPDLGTPGAVALFQSQQLDGAIAGIGDAVLLAFGHQRIVKARGKLGGNMQLEAELADISDAEREHGRAGDCHPLYPAEREARIGKVVPGQALEHLTRPRPHDRQHGICRGDIDQAGIETSGNRARDPVEIVRGEACAGDDVVFAGR